jgi:hypothetical protein
VQAGTVRPRLSRPGARQAAVLVLPQRAQRVKGVAAQCLRRRRWELPPAAPAARAGARNDRDGWRRWQATRQRGGCERNGRCRGRHQTGSVSQWSSRYGWRWWHDGGHRGGVGRGQVRQACEEAG